MTVSSLRSGSLAVMAIFVCVAVAGCSVAKLWYNHADWLLLRKIDAYLDLSPEQRAAASERLRQRLEEHRRDELPAYLDYLKRTRTLVADGLDTEEAEWLIRRGLSLARITLERTVPVIAVTLSVVSEAQVQHLEQHFEKVNRNFRRKHLPSSERERFLRSVRRTTLRIEHWTGVLSENQRQQVSELRTAFPQNARQWLRYNVGKQQRLLVLLREHADAETLSEFLIDWWINLEGRGPSLKQRTDESFDALTRLVVGVDASLDNAQRRFLFRRMDNYIEQIEELIDQK